MKKNYQIFVGIDVSKSKLDYCIVSNPSSVQHQFGIAANNEKSIKGFISNLQKKNLTNENVLFCLENTGVYSMPICFWLQENCFDYWVVPALQIKRSVGIKRGKSDKVDAKDIAMYAVSHLHQLTLSVLPEKSFLELRILLAEREKLVKAIKTFASTSENKGFLPKEILKSVLQQNKKTIVLLKQQLIKLEKLIEELIHKEELLDQQFKLLQTVPGIGKQTAVNLIVYTHAFSSFKNWRKFACYCGIAPFPYESGTTIKGKTRVNDLANKKLKSLLNLAALSAKKYDIEMKSYFERKVAEGKNKMLVLNAIRCKVLSRAFAVIQRNSPFVNLSRFKVA
jgi:transposase